MITLHKRSINEASSNTRSLGYIFITLIPTFCGGHTRTLIGIYYFFLPVPFPVSKRYSLGLSRLPGIHKKGPRVHYYRLFSFYLIILLWIKGNSFTWGRKRLSDTNMRVFSLKVYCILSSFCMALMWFLWFKLVWNPHQEEEVTRTIRKRRKDFYNGFLM